MLQKACNIVSFDIKIDQQLYTSSKVTILLHPHPRPRAHRSLETNNVTLIFNRLLMRRLLTLPLGNEKCLGSNFMDIEQTELNTL